MIKSAVKEYVFDENKNAPSCHASTVLPLNDGQVLCAWFAGKHEGDDSVSIWLSRRDADGAWSKPVIVSENDGIPHWNPVLHLRKDGAIILYYKYGKTIPEWVTKYVISKDSGLTWSAPQVLVENDVSGGRGPVKNKCLRLTSDVLLAPASTEQNNKWIPFIDISYDDGLTWTKANIMERPKYKGAYVNLIQPTLWQSDENNVHCFLRSNKGAIYRSDSADAGLTWSKPYRTRLPNNNSGIDCVKDEKGRLWLLYNPVEENWGVRYPLALSVFLDNGKHFTSVINPEINKGEYSYPAITNLGNSLYISYTYKRKKIVFWKIETE